MSNLKGLISLLVILGLLGCSAEIPVEKTRRPMSIPVGELGAEYKLNSCRYEFEAGENFLSALPQEDVRLVSFEKPMDVSRLKALGGLSAKATVRLMEDDNIAVFRMPLSVGACTMFRSLPLADQGLQEEWAMTGASTLLGMFLPVPESQITANYKPTVLIREDTDRYTLVHEYMHAIFSRHRERTGFNEEQFRRERMNRLTAVNVLLPLKKNQETDPDALARAAKAWMDYAESSIITIDNYVFEEVAVEVLLNESRDRGELQMVTPYDRANSQNYIRTNFARGQESLQSMVIAGGELKDLLRAQSMTAEIVSIEKWILRIQQRLLEGQNLVNQYAQGQVFAGGLQVHQDSLSSHAPHHGCNRMAEFESMSFPTKFPSVRSR